MMHAVLVPIASAVLVLTLLSAMLYWRLEHGSDMFRASPSAPPGMSGCRWPRPGKLRGP